MLCGVVISCCFSSRGCAGLLWNHGSSASKSTSDYLSKTPGGHAVVKEPTALHGAGLPPKTLLKVFHILEFTDAEPLLFSTCTCLRIGPTFLHDELTEGLSHG